MSVLYIRDKNGNLVPVPAIHAKSIQQTPLFANSTEECTDTTKLYVLPDGYLYAYMFVQGDLPPVTYEAQASGYWYGDEWNPTGTFKSNSSVCAKRTNVVPVTSGDTFSYRGYGTDGADAVVWLDSNQTFISKEKYDAKSSAITLTAPDGAAYAWFGSMEYAATTDSVVLDVRWINCQASTSGYQWTNTGHAFVPADYEDRIVDLEDKTSVLENSVGNSLKGKTIVYDGDSICMGYNAGGGYPAMIATVSGGSYANQAVGGGMLSASTAQHSVVNNLANLPADGDLYCFQGGINDFWGNTPIGECSMTDYTGAVDTATICGALESIFRYALTNFVGKPVCFVITHKIQNTAYTANANGDTFRDYHDAIIQVCEKYSIPYYDAFAESGLNGWNEAQSNAYLTGNSAGTADGIHPNVEGYKRYYVPQLIELFRKIMPI